MDDDAAPQNPIAAEPSAPTYEARRDPHASVIAFLLAASVVGAAAAVYGGRVIVNKALFDIAVALGIAAGMLFGVLAASLRQRIVPAPIAPPAAEPDAPAAEPDAKIGPLPWTWREMRGQLQTLFHRYSRPRVLSLAVAAGGAIAIAAVLMRLEYLMLPSAREEEIGAGALLAAVIVATLASRYLNSIDPEALREAPALARAARVMAWLFTIAGLSIGAVAADQRVIARVLHFAIAGVVIAVVYALFRAGKALSDADERFPVALGPFAALGSRPNIFASILDAGERQMGIDLRSTWALTVVRRTIEPLAISLLLLAWLTTALTVVAPEEVGIVERSGVAVAGEPLSPGLHAHWPWPVDKVFRIPVKRVQSIEIGHGGVEAPGPENVLWAVAHAPNEFSLLLGNGRDLITVDAAVHYRIVDAHAWRYNCQNPADALSALAYRAVMRNTVNRTLAEALSENVAKLTEDMRSTVQRGADSLGLGVAIVGFTVGGMHPPVEVAAAYQAVIGAEIRKVTAVVSANAYRNQIVPQAEAISLVGSNIARAGGADALARAAGEAWSFRTIEAQYRSAPEDYRFRRRLEMLESGLVGHPFTVVDARFMRDGGELWMIP